MIVQIFKVKENSLTPEFEEGDFVLIFKISRLFSGYKTGDVVVFDQPPYGRLIKRVQAVSPENGTLFVIGSHPDSIDSRQFGSIRPQAVLGKVVWHIKKPKS